MLSLCPSEVLHLVHTKTSLISLIEQQQQQQKSLQRDSRKVKDQLRKAKEKLLHCLENEHKTGEQEMKMFSYRTNSYRWLLWVREAEISISNQVPQMLFRIPGVEIE